MKHLILVDGSGYIFRAFHALPPLKRKSDGLPVGAVSGFTSMLWRLTEEMRQTDGITHFAVIFDPKGGSFRDKIYPQYKAHRPPLPEELIPQFPLTRDATRAFGVMAIEQQGFEADDVIATYATRAEAAGWRTTIVSSDKDLMQLITANIGMYDPMKDRMMGADAVFEKFGVTPEQVIDVQALMGDSTDNVPGVKGVGAKTAAALIQEYGSLDNLLENTDKIKQPKLRENLTTLKDMALISRQLVTLHCDVPELPKLDELEFHPLTLDNLVKFCQEMEFNSLTKRIIAKHQDVKVPEAKPVLAPIKQAEGFNPEGFNIEGYETISTLPQLEKWLNSAKLQGYFAFDTETTSLDAITADMVGFSLALAPNQAAYVPLQHSKKQDLFSEGALLEGQIDLKAAISALKPILEDEATLKIGQNIKYDMLVLDKYDITLKTYDDTMLMSYALDVGKNSHGMDALSALHLKHTPIKFSDVTGSGKAKITFAETEINAATRYAAEDADVTLRLWTLFKERLISEKKQVVYELLERDMVEVLARMELRGIRINREVLSRLSGELAQTALRKENEIHSLAGEVFNIGSPKQIGDILFGKLGLKGGAKTKTGQWSTSVGVMEDLADEGVEIARSILDWRQVTKLKSTYTDALPHFINPQTKRVHTSFALASTSTGRLSSSDPNVQNIPIRTEEGRKIRTAFIAAEGCKLISADYSQIELRILAHIADIPQLKKAFADGIDIHAMTASEMFNVPVEGMDSSIRRRAKAINFGIIYGISAFGLANQLSIPREEASSYIKKYFERFPRIRDYMENTKAQAREKGYVETVFGRHCHFPAMQTGSASEKAFQERAAINAPIQGSAADIIRRAMMKMEGALSAKNLNAKMLLQVHDELIFDVPYSEVEATLPVIKSVMEHAPEPFLKLSVPLIVEAKAANNWDEAH